MLLFQILFCCIFGELQLYAWEYQSAGTTNIDFICPNSTLVDDVFNSSKGVSCKTVDEYAFNDTLESKMTTIFLPRVHTVTRSLTITYKPDNIIAMIGSASMQANDTHIVLYQGDIMIQNSAKLTLSHLSVKSLSSHVVLIKTVLDVMIEDVVITGSAIIIQCLRCNAVKISNVVFTGSALVIAFPEYYLRTSYFAYKSTVIKDSVFHLAPMGNGISCCNVQALLIQNISISDLPHSSSTKPPDSSLVTFCAHYPWGMTQREVCDLLTTSIGAVEIHNSTIKRTSGTGLCIDVPLNGTVDLSKTTISDHMKGGAMFTYSDNGVEVIVRNTTLSNNLNTFSGSSEASALSVYTSRVDNTHSHIIPKLMIVRTRFISNTHPVSRPISTVSITSHVRTTIVDSDFIDNYGSAITAYTTREDHVLVIFYGTIVFRNNTSHRGGAIHLFKSRIGLTRNTNISFEHNFAEDIGGAIYVHSTKWLSSYYEIENGNYGDCFFVLIDCNSVHFRDYFTVRFDNNSAKNGGEHIFGASLLSNCNVCPFSSIASSVIIPLFTFNRPGLFSFSPVSSYPSRVCICKQLLSDLYNPHYFCANTSLIFLSKSVYPGEVFNLKAVLVGTEFGTVTGVVYSQFLSPSSAQLHPSYQYSQRIHNFKGCTQLSYTVYSSSSNDVLVLTANDETVIKYGNQEELMKESSKYHYDFANCK